MTDGSRWSWRSKRSLLSVASEDSVLCIGSKGSALAFQADGGVLATRTTGPLPTWALPLGMAALAAVTGTVVVRSRRR